jgi:hypothetical protein
MEHGRRARCCGSLLLLLFCALATPAPAQGPYQAPPIVPNIDKPCELSEEEIVVCGRREQRRSPYRLPDPPPRFDAGEGTASVSRERHSLYEHGCTFRKWKDSDEQWGGKGRGTRKRPGEFGQ